MNMRAIEKQPQRTVKLIRGFILLLAGEETLVNCNCNTDIRIIICMYLCKRQALHKIS